MNIITGEKFQSLCHHHISKDEHKPFELQVDNHIDVDKFDFTDFDNDELFWYILAPPNSSHQNFYGSFNDEEDKFYIDSLVHNSDSLDYLLNKIGPNQIALGTDYPFPLGEAESGRMISDIENLSIKDKERLFSGTALEWLNLDKKIFI